MVVYTTVHDEMCVCVRTAAFSNWHCIDCEDHIEDCIGVF